jgi:hypothetical protein
MHHPPPVEIDPSQAPSPQALGNIVAERSTLVATPLHNPAETPMLHFRANAFCMMGQRADEERRPSPNPGGPPFVVRRDRRYRSGLRFRRQGFSQ